MKNSYYKTPRTLDESTFHSWGNAAFKETKKDADLIVTIVSVLSIVAVCVFAVIGWLD